MKALPTSYGKRRSIFQTEPIIVDERRRGSKVGYCSSVKVWYLLINLDYLSFMTFSRIIKSHLGFANK